MTSRKHEDIDSQGVRAGRELRLQGEHSLFFHFSDEKTEAQTSNARHLVFAQFHPTSIGRTQNTSGLILKPVLSPYLIVSLPEN